MVRNLLVVGLVVGLLSGCACHTKKVNPEENIGMVADSSGPLKDVNYGFDSAELSEGAKATLSANAEYLKANGSVATQIEGHCDERGTNEYNMALGNRRAVSAHKFLRGLGIDAKRMSTVSYGEELPLAAGHDEAAWAQNRRAHFKIEAK